VPSLSWWEHFGRYQAGLDAVPFTFHFLSRSITRGKLARRDPGFVAEVDRWWRAQHDGAPPLGSPLRLTSWTLPARQGVLRGTDAVLVGDVEVPVAVASPGRTPPDASHAWLVTVPEDAEARAQLDRWLEEHATPGACPLLVLTGEDELAGILRSEWARMERAIPTALVGDLDPDEAETVVLSGRTDLVLRREERG
jgi:salicyloyl-CoA 5-hydroxylase